MISRVLTPSLAVFFVAARALAGPLVAIVPLRGEDSSLSSLAEAYADAAVARLIASGTFTTSVRQVRAAAEQARISLAGNPADPQLATLGMQLGADWLITAALSHHKEGIGIALAARPGIDAAGDGARALKFRHTTASTAGADDLSQAFDAATDGILAQIAPKTAVPPKPQPTPRRTMQTWQQIGSTLALLAPQSLGPRAADPSMPPSIGQADLQQVLGRMHAVRQAHPRDALAAALLAQAQALLDPSSTAARESLAEASALLKPGEQVPAVLPLAFAAMRGGRFDQAEVLLEAAVAARPGFFHGLVNLGELYNHFGRFREALAVYRRCARLAPHQVWVKARVGYTLAKLGQFDAAIAATREALALQPKSAYLTVELASRFVDARRLPDALRLLATARRLNSSDGDSSDGRIDLREGYIYLLQGRDRQALHLAEKALQSGTLRGRDVAYAHLNRARALGHLGDIEAAIAALRRAVQMGLPSLFEVEDDPKLASLRQHPGFAGIAE